MKSAGVGPSMRSAIIGAFHAEDHLRRREFALASARLTHKGWQAESAALAVADCAALAVRTGQTPTPAETVELLRKVSDEPEWQAVVGRIDQSAKSGCEVGRFAKDLGLERGVSGYALHAVPVAIYAWLRHPMDFRTAMTCALDCGGDTDTVGAILGGLMGACTGAYAIPEEWAGKVAEWPRSLSFMRRVALRLAESVALGSAVRPVACFWPALIVRNLVLLMVVLIHGFRRLTPRELRKR